MDEYYDAIRLLPAFLRLALVKLDPTQACLIQEIRLRSGRPAAVTLQGRACFITPEGTLTQTPDQGLRLGQTELLDAWHSLCGYSVHSVERELARGFFTLRGGHRVGVAGIAHWAGETQDGWRVVTSLNIRIARAVSAPLPEQMTALIDASGSWILVGPPGSGKTTLLRQVAYALSEKGRRVAVVDERCELFPCTSRGFALPVPYHCDVLSDMPKAEGILSAVRSLGPQDVLCDELGGAEDMAAVQQGLGCGVRFVASIHGETREDLQLRCGALLGKGGFEYAVLLKGNQAPGQIAEIMTLK